VHLDELYEAAQLRVPVDGALPPLADDALGSAVRQTMEKLRGPLHELLRQPVSSVYAGLSEE
jgi:hypothetical protein